jgi:hypothetical protein
MHPYLTWNIGPRALVKHFPWYELISCVCSQMMACVCRTVLLAHHISRKKSPHFHSVPPFWFFITLVYHALANTCICLSQNEGLLGFLSQYKKKRTGFPKEIFNKNLKLFMTTRTFNICTKDSFKQLPSKVFSGFRMQLSSG